MFVLSERMLGLETGETFYINPVVPSRIIAAYTVLNEVIASGDVDITISDGTTDVGVITIANSGVAVGDIDEITFDSTSKGKVIFGPATPIKIVGDGGSTGTGELTLTLVMDEFHGD